MQRRRPARPSPSPRETQLRSPRRARSGKWFQQEASARHSGSAGPEAAAVAAVERQEPDFEHEHGPEPGPELEPELGRGPEPGQHEHGPGASSEFVAAAGAEA